MKVTKLSRGVYDVKVNDKVYGINQVFTSFSSAPEWELYDCSCRESDPSVNWIDTFDTKRDCIEWIKRLEEIN